MMITFEDAYEIAGMINDSLPPDIRKHYNYDNVRDLLAESDDADEDGNMPIEAAIREIKLTLDDAFTYVEVERVVRRITDREVMFIYDRDGGGYEVVFEDDARDTMHIAISTVKDQ
jgi:hypothetical protein